MIKNFDSYFEWLMRQEGEVLERVKNDRGGLTKFGIDQRSHPNVNISALTREGARKIYETEFASFCAGFAAPLCWAMFDGEINQGRGGMAKCLQRALGVEVDGVIGPATRDALRRAALLPLTFKLLDERERSYRRIAANDATQRDFLAGWLNRVHGLKRELTV